MYSSNSKDAARCMCVFTICICICMCMCVCTWVGRVSIHCNAFSSHHSWFSKLVIQTFRVLWAVEVNYVHFFYYSCHTLKFWHSNWALSHLPLHTITHPLNVTAVGLHDDQVDIYGDTDSCSDGEWDSSCMRTWNCMGFTVLPPC